MPSKKTKVRDCNGNDPSVKSKMGKAKEKEAKVSELHEVDTSVKHPLHTEWTMWLLLKEKNLKWDEGLRNVYTVGTIQDFWSLFDSVPTPSCLTQNCDLNFFRAGIKPMWEDPANERGGRLLITLHKSELETLDAFWMDTLMCMIGEQFGSHGPQVTGAVVQLRPKENKLAVWTRTSDRAVVTAMGNNLKNYLLAPRLTIQFQLHFDVKGKTSSHCKSFFI